MNLVLMSLGYTEVTIFFFVRDRCLSMLKYGEFHIAVLSKKKANYISEILRKIVIFEFCLAFPAKKLR